MNPFQQFRSAILLILLALVTGCQTLATGDAQQQPTPPAQGMITVEVRPAGGGKRSQKQVALQPNMRMQSLLDATKTGFRNTTMYIVRESPATGRKHKLEARFSSSRRISLETDYAIQPGDHVIIAQDTVGPMQKAVRSMLGRS